MNPTLRLRLAFGAVTAGLLLLALAYYWLGNVAHEVIGTAMFVLVILHNVFNRRRYASLSRARAEPRGILDIAVVTLLASTMLALLVTSLLISNAVFSGLRWDGGFTARQIHALAGYGGLIIVSIHLGLRWPTIMGAMRKRWGLENRGGGRAAVLRVLAAAVVVQGVFSSFQLAVGTKLSMQISLDWWDFDASVASFFYHWLAVAGLYIVITYYGVQCLQAARAGNSTNAWERS